VTPRYRPGRGGNKLVSDQKLISQEEAQSLTGITRLHALKAVPKAEGGRGKKGGLSEYAERIGKSQDSVSLYRKPPRYFGGFGLPRQDLPPLRNPQTPASLLAGGGDREGADSAPTIFFSGQIFPAPHAAGTIPSGPLSTDRSL